MIGNRVGCQLWLLWLSILVITLPEGCIAAIPIGAIAAVYMASRAIAAEQWSWVTRLEAWQIVLEISKASPIFGLGFANYHFYTKLIPIMGWYVKLQFA